MKTMLNGKKGQGLTEYGIILVLVAVSGIGAFALFGDQIKRKVEVVAAAVSGDSAKFEATSTEASAAFDSVKAKVETHKAGMDAKGAVLKAE